ncbi:biotin transporter BioY [Lentilactobacillus diolivorans]|uniref:biotin transporter BioY n=1 Tax=Lentilactobacillus diolivorans TaxID=179838 RepID=UPI002468E9F6|nr:biotin transporter BioY [Lentilactobacillus diolivorans]MDH5104689.1 biotin transporter BioY [Lentilactobacillus diolivorans]
MKIKEIVQTSLIAATIIILGMIPPLPLGIIPVPVVMQNLGIMLAGALLGSKRGTIAVALVLLLALIGFPVLSGGSAGPAVFVGPTGGYLFGWLMAPSIMGYGLSQPFVNRAWSKMAVIWLVGSIWLWLVSPISLVNSLISNLAFIPGDTLKSIAVYLVAVRVQALTHVSTR